ncbi:MAG: acyl-CoA dehydrogenase family protein [Pseudomonadota bacterium]|nr:acyl-CoA dehydrogenase family protein [Pseudomonadota bacterium]
MDARSLAWPFFDPAHRSEAASYAQWCSDALPSLLASESAGSQTVYATVAEMVRGLGRAGLLRACADAHYGGLRDTVEVRSLCIAREVLAEASGLADFAFAMQGLGAAPISLFGTDEQKQHYLPGIVDGSRIGAFALSEPNAGSDVAAITTTATRSNEGWRLDGVKTWISNAGIASQYVVFARTGEGPGSKGLSAFVVDASCTGLRVEPIEVMAPHPLGTLHLEACQVPAQALLGSRGTGFAIAMATLDLFRSSVGAAALGFARRAFREAAHHASQREMFGRKLLDMQLTQLKLGEMALAIDASALLIYRAAWTRDVLGSRITREASMAKLFATESAQQVIDGAVQLLGGLGIVRGTIVERLYREIRALRIYEGATEVLKLVIGAKAASEILQGDPAESARQTPAKS